jgi:hypothetical protein
MQTRQKSIHDIVHRVTDSVHCKIKECSSPKGKQNNALFKPLILAAQNDCDAILNKPAHSSLEKIIACAKVVEKYEAGNCLMQCYLAFNTMLNLFLDYGLANYQNCIPLCILTTSNHAFLLVNNQFICDPLFGTVKTLLNPGSLNECQEYFGIRDNWQCYINWNELDQQSTAHTYHLLPAEQQIELNHSNSQSYPI